MNIYRKYTSIIVAITFLIVSGTGLCFLFHFKSHAMMELHQWLGVIMVLGGLVHIALNWRSLQQYLLDKRVYFILIPIILVTAGLLIGGPNPEPRGMNPHEIMMKLSQASNEDLAKIFGSDADTLIKTIKNNGQQQHRYGKE